MTGAVGRDAPSVMTGGTCLRRERHDGWEFLASQDDGPRALVGDPGATWVFEVLSP